MIQALPPTQLISRRSLLCAAGALCLPAGVLCAQPTQRSLSFVHTHTGENLSVNYWCDGAYQSDCLGQINHLLRDFRTGEVFNMDAQLLDLLYQLQVRADRDAVFEVISGYRSPQTNAALSAKSEGVAKHSLHMEGKAIDIRITGFATRKLQQLALTDQRGGVGYYAKSDFVHVDTGRVRSWVG